MKTNKMNLGKKLTVIVSSLLAMLLVLSGLSIYSLSQMRNFYEDGVVNGTEKVRLVGRMSESQGELSMNVQSYLMNSMTQATAEAQQSKTSFNKVTSDFEKDIVSLRALLVTQEAQQALGEIESGLRDWQRLFKDIDAAVAGGKLDEALKLSAERSGKLHATLNAGCARIETVQKGVAQQKADSSRALASLVLWVTILFVAAGAIVGIWSLYTVLRVSKGLRVIATEIGEGATQVASAASQVSSASQSVAQSASEQAASLEETSASTEELNSMTQRNAESAHSASNETSAVDQLLKDTSQRLDGMIASMREINSSSEKISKIIKVIDEIAFQTNILALNAAVEAARAGEAGMGFAVVADEVRNLAQRCAQAAKDTSELIEESITRSNEGRTRLDDVVTSIGKVVDNAGKIRILANEVHVGSQEQARGIEQISRAVSQMQQVTQSTAASAEESASAGEEMSCQADSLRAAVTRLSDVVGVDNSLPPSASKVSAKPAIGGTIAKFAASVSKASGPTVKPQKSAALAAKHAFPLDEDFKDF